jgi:myosin heavy subunit
VRGAQILDAVRLHKVGFPENLAYAQFWRRFSLLGKSENSLLNEVDKTGVSLGEM